MQFLPGPASSQLGVAIGMLRAGPLGGLAAWLGFTLPSAVRDRVRVRRRRQPTWRTTAGCTAWSWPPSPSSPWPSGRWPGGWPAAWCGRDRRRRRGLVLVGGGPRSARHRGRRRSVGCSCAERPVRRGRRSTSGRRAGRRRPASRRPCWRAAAGAPGDGHPGRRAERRHLPVGRAGLRRRSRGAAAAARAVGRAGWVAEADFVAGYGAAQAVPGPLFTFAGFLGAVRARRPTASPAAPSRWSPSSCPPAARGRRGPVLDGPAGAARRPRRSPG